MKNSLILIYLFIVALFLSCSSTKVFTDYDETANFNNYKTFNFSKNARELPVDDLINNRILNGITSNLKSKGFIESDSPDLIVDLNVKTKNKKDYSNTNVNLSTVWGKKWRFRTGVGKTYSKEINYTEGTLVINLIDREKDNLIWKGSGTDIVKEKSLQRETISKAINEIMKSFPPIN